LGFEQKPNSECSSALPSELLSCDVGGTTVVSPAATTTALVGVRLFTTVPSSMAAVPATAASADRAGDGRSNGEGPSRLSTLVLVLPVVRLGGTLPCSSSGLEPASGL
jgi:hypothetical protein